MVAQPENFKKGQNVLNLLRLAVFMEECTPVLAAVITLIAYLRTKNEKASYNGRATPCIK